MERLAYCDGKLWGRAEMREDGAYLTITVSGGRRDDSVYRAYAMPKNHAPLLLGVLEPSGQGMQAVCRYSKPYLGRMGCWPEFPERVEISCHGAPETPQKRLTGDPLLDNVLTQGRVSLIEEKEETVLTCPFRPDKEFPLSFAFAVCSVEEKENGWHAVLRLKK